MKTTMNLAAAIKTIRKARQNHQISKRVQQRLMRRLQSDAPFAQSANRWQSLMTLRAHVERELAPVILARREADLDIFQIRHIVPKEKIKGFIPQQVQNPTNTPEWWRAASKRDKAKENAERRAIKAACKAAGVSKEDMQAVIRKWDSGEVTFAELMPALA